MENHSSGSGNSSSSSGRRSHRNTKPTRPGLVDKAFDGCVDLLYWAADKTGTTYKQINVAVFCVIWPAVTIALTVGCLKKHKEAP